MELNINLNRYVTSIDHGYNEAGEIYDLEVLSNLIFDEIEGQMSAAGLDIYEEEGSAAFRDWCNRNNVHYYAAPKEDFSRAAALDRAACACARFVLMEDLS